MTEISVLDKQFIAKRYTHLIFDLDRTLTELDLPWQIWIEAVTAILPPVRQKELATALSKAGEPWGNVINRQIMDDGAFFADFIQICQTFEQEHFAHSPYPELVNWIRQLPDDIILSLWTSNTLSTAERTLTEMNIRDRFTTLITRESSKLGKPDTEAWALINPTNQPKTTFLFVGDSKNDSECAAAIGLDYFNIRYFYN